MANIKKYENSVIRSLRVPSLVDDFLRDTFITSRKKGAFTSNEFVNKLIQDSKEYKSYLAQINAKSQEPSLF